MTFARPGRIKYQLSSEGTLGLKGVTHKVVHQGLMIILCGMAIHIGTFDIHGLLPLCLFDLRLLSQIQL